MILKFTEYILESKFNELLFESQIILSEPLKMALYDINNNVTTSILSATIHKKDIEKLNYTYLDYEDNKITFTSPNRVDKLSNPWSDKSRNSARVGRIMKALYKDITNKDAPDKEIEEINNELRAIFDKKDNFKIVKGKDILWYYEENSYIDSEEGSLGQSCMKHEECQEYFGIYDDYYPNSKAAKETGNSIELLILLDDAGFLKGRALIWNLRNGVTFIDRVYTTDSKDVSKFKRYASKNKWWMKYSQNYRVEGNIVDHNGISISIKNLEKLEFYLDNEGYDQYPYMDTMKYYIFDDNEKLRERNDSGGTYPILKASLLHLNKLDLKLGENFVPLEETDGNEMYYIDDKDVYAPQHIKYN